MTRTPEVVEHEVSVLYELINVSNKTSISRASMREFVVGLAAIGASKREIALVLGADVASIEIEYKDELERGAAIGDISLRREQMRVALAGNPLMLKFLGENRLGQRGRPEPQEEVKNDEAERMDPRESLRTKLEVMSGRIQPA